MPGHRVARHLLSFGGRLGPLPAVTIRTRAPDFSSSSTWSSTCLAEGEV